MQRIFNKDGFNWWIGVVEDRMDPEKLGRVKIRIFGYHTDDKTLLPTSDLPWAWPIQPITSAALNGIGSSPLGPLPGTWVIGFNLDGNDFQVPAYFGTIASKGGSVGIPGITDKKFDTVEQKDTIQNPKDPGVLKDSEGNPVTDGSGNPIQTGVPQIPGWELGKTSEKYESGGKGPGVISPRVSGDYGGASYGTYQFASFLPAVASNGKARPSAKNSPVVQYVKNSKFKDKFNGLEPATNEFDSVWSELASSRTKEFKDDQHDYIKAKYYDVMIAGLQRQGLDLSKYGPGVQDLIWSTAVQLGPAKTSIFTEPLKGKSELTDKDIINLVSAYKITNVEKFFASSSASIQASVKNRWETEKNDLLKLVKA